MLEDNIETPPLSKAYPTSDFAESTYPTNSPVVTYSEPRSSDSGDRGGTRKNNENTTDSHLVQSGSGHHRGRGTDTESVCSMDSDGSSLGMPQDFLQDFVTSFGDMLIEQAGARAWIEIALAQHSPDVIEKRLDSLLKEYTIDVQSTEADLTSSNIDQDQRRQSNEIKDRVVSNALSLIRRYRPRIARYFRNQAINNPNTSESMALQPQGKKEEVDDDDLAYLEPMREFLTSGEPFRRLVGSMRRSFYYDDLGSMDCIKRHIEGRLSSDELLRDPCETCSSHACLEHQISHSVSFNVQWSLEKFLRSQFGDQRPKFDSIVTLTGSALYAQASTCSRYFEMTWPSSGEFVLSTIQRAFDEKTHEVTASTDDLCLRVILANQVSTSHDTSSSSAQIHACGSSFMLVDLAQQLAWLGATLTFSPYHEDVAYCEPTIQSDETSCPVFTLSFQSKPLRHLERPCWLPLFCGASIAYGFPIPERQGEVGLEIPIPMMAAIAGAQHAIEYRGGVVIKGFSTMFVPTTRHDDLVQWHLVTSPNRETRLLYRDVLRYYPHRASIDHVSLENLHTTRAIVGWCTSAVSLLGSDTADYENIDYSGASQVGRPINFSGGALGFQQFGIAQFNFMLGPKDGKVHFQRSGPYERVISAADKTHIVLYDTADQRAWLEPASNVMLHMAHHRHMLEPFRSKGKRIKLPATSKAQPFASHVLLENANLKLSEYEDYTFKDMILNFWSLLEGLIEEDSARDGKPGVAVNNLQDEIQGYEFKAVVEDRSPFRRKRRSVKTTTGGWPALIRDIDALVLFANGFGDIIQPSWTDANTTNLCHRWRRLPTEGDYLATSVRSLMDLYNVAGCRLSQNYLTSTHLQWHRGQSVLFEPCESPGSYQCNCDRLQQIVPESVVRTVSRPGILAGQGAVIFGRCRSSIRERIKIPQRPKVSKLYSQQNVTFQNSIGELLGTDDTSSIESESELSALSSPDTICKTSTTTSTSTSLGSTAVGLSMPSSGTRFSSGSSQTLCIRKRPHSPSTPDLLDEPAGFDQENTQQNKRRDLGCNDGNKPQASHPPMHLTDTSSQNFEHSLWSSQKPTDQEMPGMGPKMDLFSEFKQIDVADTKQPQPRPEGRAAVRPFTSQKQDEEHTPVQSTRLPHHLERLIQT